MQKSLYRFIPPVMRLHFEVFKACPIGFLPQNKGSLSDHIIAYLSPIIPAKRK